MVRAIFAGVAAAGLWAAAGPVVSVAQAPPPDALVKSADRLFEEGRYRQARDTYALAVSAEDRTLAVRAASGVVTSLLRVGEFQMAYEQAEAFRRDRPDDPALAAVYGDALWSSGRFEEAEAAYEAALQGSAAEPRARHGRARALASLSRLEAALEDAREALRLRPDDAEFHYTLGALYERMHRFEDAADAFSRYVDLLPNRDRSEKAAWARAEIRFLDSFRRRRPFDLGSHAPERQWVIPIRIEHEKVFVQGRVNGGRPREFVLDTGAEQTVISRDVARLAGVAPITYMQSAGVGDVGVRGMQVGRIDRLEFGDLRIRHVPCLIKNPPLGGLPADEPDSFSPLAIGLSMRIDYQARQLVLGRRLPAPAGAEELQLRMYRLAMVRGTVNGSLPASFVVDTGGEVISISDATAGLIQPETPFRRIPLKVYGTSGWDKDAFLMPNVDLDFNAIQFRRIPVVVLNLRAPSALLGVQLGGIVGHKFLSRYRVTIDLERSVVALE